MRERLIELLEQVGANVLNFPTDNFIESLAQYLVEHKVKVLLYDIGDFAYCLTGIVKDIVTPCRVEAVNFSKREVVYTVSVGYMQFYLLEDEIFSTKEEAEKALERSKINE